MKGQHTHIDNKYTILEGDAILVDTFLRKNFFDLEWLSCCGETELLSS